MSKKTPANERIVLTAVELEIMDGNFEHPLNCEVCHDFLGFGVGDKLHDRTNDRLVCQPCMALARLRIRLWKEQP